MYLNTVLVVLGKSFVYKLKMLNYTSIACDLHTYAFRDNRAWTKAITKQWPSDCLLRIMCTKYRQVFTIKKEMAIEK